MSEYDYSGLYNNPQNSGGQPTGGQPAQPQTDPQASPAYPNVGSSGMNTANTAQTDYSGQPADSAPEANAQSAPNVGQNAPGYGSAHTSNTGSGAYDYSSAHTSNTGSGAYDYSSAHTSNTGSGAYDYSSAHTANTGSGAYNYGSARAANGGSGGYHGGYSYASGPAPQPEQKPKKKGGKILLRVAACVGVAAIGFGGGLAGTVVASRAGLTGGQVVVQEVQRDTSASSAAQDSTGGATLSVQEISAIVQPSVVAITTEQMVSTNTWFGGSYVQSGAGSGVIISQDGYILTCAHVVSGASTITVQLEDNNTYAATVVGQDSTSDVAVLKIDATGLTPAVIGDSDSLAVGETAIAVGNPLGTLSNTVTDGIISALNREVTVKNNRMTLIQTNASISPGNSGGGLFNANGELIGIVNAKSSSSNAEGLGFAIPINTAMDFAKQIIENGYVARPALGVTVITISDSQKAMQYGVSDYGVYVYQINSGSGAEAAGLQLGDRIISIDDTAVSSASDLQKYCQSKEVGDTVTLQVERDGKVISCEVTLGVSSTSTDSASTSESSTQQNSQTPSFSFGSDGSSNYSA